MQSMKHLPTVLTFTILSLLVVGLSADAIWKHHVQSQATVLSTNAAVQQRNQAVQALRNEQGVNESLRSSVTTVTADKNGLQNKLAVLCALPANKLQAACK